MNIRVGYLYILFVIAVLIYGQINQRPPVSTKLDPIHAEKVVSKPIPSASPVPTKIPEPKSQSTVIRGLASYYSRAGCLDCSPSLTMANGEPLDDTKLTVAFMRAPLGTIIKITNVQTRQSVFAEVTDTGGFEHVRIPKIVDLSVATKEAIGCPSTCEVEIEL